MQAIQTFGCVDRYFWCAHTRICILYILVVKRWSHWHFGVVFLPCTQHNCIWNFAQRFSSLTGCLTSVCCLLIMFCVRKWSNWQPFRYSVALLYRFPKAVALRSSSKEDQTLQKNRRWLLVFWFELYRANSITFWLTLSCRFVGRMILSYAFHIAITYIFLAP